MYIDCIGIANDITQFSVRAAVICCLRSIARRGLIEPNLMASVNPGRLIAQVV